MSGEDGGDKAKKSGGGVCLGFGLDGFIILFSKATGVCGPRVSDSRGVSSVAFGFRVCPIAPRNFGRTHWNSSIGGKLMRSFKETELISDNRRWSLPFSS